VFFKSCMELDFSNMVSILSFDAESMKFLLNEQFSDVFEERTAQRPLFYKNRIQKGPSKLGKYFYRSAVENALKNN